MDLQYLRHIMWVSFGSYGESFMLHILGKVSTKKRFLISFFLFWGIGYLSFQQFLHDKSWSLELLLIFLAGYIFTVFIPYNPIKVIVKIFLGIVLTVFITQAIFVFKNGEYISTLAIENINQLYLVMGYKEYCILIFIFSFLSIILTSLRKNNNSVKDVGGG